MYTAKLSVGPPTKGNLVSLESVIQRKFGQAGLDAIKKYPFLVGSKIDAGYFLLEQESSKGTSGLASQFEFKKQDPAYPGGVHATYVSAAELGAQGQVVHDGKIIWEKGSNILLYLAIGAAILAVVGFLVLRKNK